MWVSYIYVDLYTYKYTFYLVISYNYASIEGLLSMEYYFFVFTNCICKTFTFRQPNPIDVSSSQSIIP